MITVLVVDDQTIIREGLRVVLNASATVRVVGTAADGASAVEQALALRPDLVLMDLNMPLVNGIQATQTLRAQLPETPVLVLTTYADDAWVLDAVRAGAAGYLLKDTGADALVAAIEGVIAGRTLVDPQVAQRLFTYVRHGAPARGTAAADLTERELAVLRLLGNGLSNAAIADQLALAEGTVRNHVSAILAKLDLTDRAQATAYAWRYGLVTP